MSTYGNTMNTMGGPVSIRGEAPKIETLKMARHHWQCFLVSYAIEVAVLGALAVISIAAPQIAPQLEAQVELVAPYLDPAPAPALRKATLRHAVTVAPVLRPVLPAPQVEQPVAKVEVPVLVAPRLESLRKTAPVAEVARPKAVPIAQFDSKLLAVSGPKAERIVAVNTFGGSSAAPTLHKVAPAQVQTGGFGDPNGVPVNARGSEHAGIAAVGSFDLPAGGGHGNGTGGSRGLRGTVASAGFGNGIAVQGGGGRGGSAAQGQVRSGGFAAEAAPPANPQPMRHAALAAASSPVFIQSKPSPIYTAEARQLKIEGEVLLSVEFLADGHIRVLNLVHGLGHGLDEAAQRAASGIRFRPAMRDGRPVNSTATLHIIFQLS